MGCTVSKQAKYWQRNCHCARTRVRRRLSESSRNPQVKRFFSCQSQFVCGLMGAPKKSGYWTMNFLLFEKVGKPGSTVAVMKRRLQSVGKLERRISPGRRFRNRGR